MNIKQGMINFTRVISNKIFNKLLWKHLYTDEFIFKLIQKKRKHLWLISAPKSGSTWLSTLLNYSLQWKNVRLVPSLGAREQEADPRQIIIHGANTVNTFSPHQHCRYNSNTASVIRQGNIKVVLQLRNIYDTVLSIKDNLDKTKMNFPGTCMDKESWDLLTDEQRTNFVIDIIVPWYFKFFYGWFKSDLLNSGQILVVTYEQLVSNTFKTLNEILAFIEEPKMSEQINKAIFKASLKETKMNKGIIGRGSQLSLEQKRRIIDYSKYWKNMDFSLLGIE
ncbi:MAG: hypothetical protein HOI47_25740 [Candidatus Scalindua sp.]|jgi:hypothetical protein|nr:hypothetical protein [Candidatus Scalindua sp.]